MKQKKLMLVAFLFLVQFVSAQLNSSLTLCGGVVEQKNSFGFMANYNYNKNNSNYELGVLHSMFTKSVNSEIDTKFSVTTLNAGYLHTLIRSRDNAISINFGIGVFGGYEQVPENKDLIITSESGAVYGGYGAGQLDFYTTDNFAFILRAQQNYYVQSNTGQYNPFFAFGLKFNF